MFKFKFNLVRAIKLKQLYFIGIFLLVLLLWGGVFLYKQFQHYNQGLINYMPAGTFSYWQISFNQPNLVKAIKQKPWLKQQIEAWLVQDGLPVNIWHGQYQITQLALAQVKLNKAADNLIPLTAKAWLVYSPDDLSSLVATQLKDYYCKFLDRHTALLTTSEDLFINYQPAEKDFFSSVKLGSGKNLLALGFLNLDNFFQNKDIINTGFAESSLSHYLYWRLDSVANGFALNIDLPFVFKNDFVLGGAELKQRNRGALVWPEELGVWFGFRPEMVFSLLENNFLQRWGISHNELKTFLEEKYKISFDKLYTFFKQPYYVIFKFKPGKKTLKDLFDLGSYDFVMLSRRSVDRQVLKNLKQLISSYIAYQHPVQKKKILPDGSWGFELVADNTKWHWQEKDVYDGTLGLLETSGYQVSYFNSPQFFMLGNSQPLINEVLESEYDHSLPLIKTPQTDIWIGRNFWLPISREARFDIRVKNILKPEREVLEIKLIQPDEYSSVIN